MITRNRSGEALHALDRLIRLPDEPPVIVVDNGSTDDTGAAVRAAYGDRVTLLALGPKAGAAGRNAGCLAASARYVAFADDDSAWAPGGLRRAAAHLDGNP